MMLWIVAVAGLTAAGGFVVRARADVPPPAAPTAASTAKAPVDPVATLPAPSGSAAQHFVQIYAAPHPPPPPGKGKTYERQAADAVHAGDIRRAASIYAELAQKFPENAAYAAAANVFAKKLK